MYTPRCAQPMENLPNQMIEYLVLEHLDAFDAHRFGLTQQRALQVITDERARSKAGAETQYDRWFDDVDAKVTTLISTLCKECAEDPENEYAPAIQDALRGINKCSWDDDLWELITGGLCEQDLEGFANRTVEAHEECCRWDLERCAECGLLNSAQYMNCWWWNGHWQCYACS